MKTGEELIGLLPEWIVRRVAGRRSRSMLGQALMIAYLQGMRDVMQEDRAALSRELGADGKPKG